MRVDDVSSSICKALVVAALAALLARLAPPRRSAAAALAGTRFAPALALPPARG